MVLNTATVGTAVAPAVVGTFISHYLNRKPRAKKPTAHISYDEGLHLIRQFLEYASHHTVEDLQRFTAQWVPHPRWVRVEQVMIPQEQITAAAEAIQAQLGRHGIEKVGGKNWWQWRRPGSDLSAEWIEMRSDFQERKISGDSGKRVMLYVHGGAYYFGSVDEHRYQMQRHARKLKARVFAREYFRRPRYRLAPQFPFPCGLHDCLAAYMYLLTVQDPTTIIFAGDSAGGGMILSMLVTLRDRGLPLPAGAVLISPWVDLTHSFPSVSGDSPLDYIPSQGFHSRPSAAWPPPNENDMLAIAEGRVRKLAHDQNTAQSTEADAVQGFHVEKINDDEPKSEITAADRPTNSRGSPEAHAVPTSGHCLSIMIDSKLIEIKDQIQMYATNQLISHPLVSPILQPSLGGLPPLLILTGGGELLRDEQIYLAHKAANPTKYPPSDACLDEHAHEHDRDQINRWKPTDVQLQVWDDLCHVAPTLSFTRPAKYMYRSIAQFGAWALARAQQSEIEIMDDDNVSIISQSNSDAESDPKEKNKDAARGKLKRRSGQVGKAGDPLPPFKNHMIRQRVDRNGGIYPLEHAQNLPGCTLTPNEIGVIKEGPVRKWIAAKREWDTKFASAKRRVQRERAKEMMDGYQPFEGEVPPPSALAGRRRKGEQDRAEKNKKSWGMSLWSKWGSKHDVQTMEREQQADREADSTVVTGEEGANSRPLNDIETNQGALAAGQSTKSYSRSRSRRTTVTDEHQTEQLSSANENTSVGELLALRREKEADAPIDWFSNSNIPEKVDSKIPTETALDSPVIASAKAETVKAEFSPLKSSALGRVEDKGPKDSLSLSPLSPTLSTAINQPLPLSPLSPTLSKAVNQPLPLSPVTPTTSKAADEELNFDFAFSSEKPTLATAGEKGLKIETPTPLVKPSAGKAEAEGLKAESPVSVRSPVIDKAEYEGVKAESPRSPNTPTLDKAEAEGLKSQFPLPAPTIKEPTPEPSRQKSKSKRPKSNGIAFPFSLRRSGTNKSATPSVASTATLTSSLGVPPSKEVHPKLPSKDDEKDWKDLEAGPDRKKSVKENKKFRKDQLKALEAGVALKKSASTREAKKSPLAKKDDWKAVEADAPAPIKRAQTENVMGSGSKKPLPMLKKRELPMLKKDAQRPQTESFVTANEDLSKPQPAFAKKAIDSDQKSEISDYCTW